MSSVLTHCTVVQTTTFHHSDHHSDSSTKRGILNPKRLPTMSSDGQRTSHRSEHNEGNTHASFHPPNTGQSDLSQNPAGVGSSVVKDLLRVYESLTQSSTPQTSTEEFSGKSGPQGSVSFSTTQATSQYSGHSAQVPGGYAHPNAPPMYHIPPPTYPPSQQQIGSDQPSYGHYPYGMPPSSNEHHALHGYPMPGYDIPISQPNSNEQGSDAQDTEEELPESNNGRARRKRRGSEHSSSISGQKGRKKSKATDGRWSKRFTWPDDLHRDFVSAIFDVGLKHSSPSTILEHMPQNDQITTERIKSHLQKYRMHRVKSKKEFISSYELSLRGYQENGMEPVKSVSGGDTAAQVSYMEISGIDPTLQAPPAAKPEPVEQEQKRSPQQNEVLMLPQLSESEKASPMGAALGHLMGLFLSLKQQLVAQRIAEGKKRAEAQAAAAALNSASNVDTSHEGASQSFKSGQSGRTNIEENSIMKREMQNQMELQNKMRALKQQELNKYKSLPSAHNVPVAPYDNQTPAPTEEHSEQKFDPRDSSHAQGAGESGGSDGDEQTGRGENHPRGFSLGNQDDFWNTDIVDDQLFEFLLNN